MNQPSTSLAPSPAGQSRRRYGWLYAVAALALLAWSAYATADASIVRWVHAQGIDAAAKKLHWLRGGRIWWPGHFLCTLLIAAGLWRFSRHGWRGALLLAMAGVLSGSNSILKWLAGRQRPHWKTGDPAMAFSPCNGGLELLFNQRNLAFPSGDVALATATAACLSWLMPRWAVAWWIMAIIVAVQRVAENAHHLSDTLAAAALGILCFELARIVLRPLSPSAAATDVRLPA